MNPWLDRLKNQKSLDNNPTKPTKLTAEAPKGGSVGFVGSGGGALEKMQSTYEGGFVGFVGPVLAYSEKFEIRASHFKALGLPSSDALALAQSCERRDAEGLDMHTCLECANVRPQQQYLRCRGGWHIKGRDSKGHLQPPTALPRLQVAPPPGTIGR